QAIGAVAPAPATRTQVGASCIRPSRCAKDTNVRHLPLALRWYLWAIYLACLILIVVQVSTFMPWAPSHWSLALMEQILVFVALGLLGESISLRGRDPIVLNLGSVVHIALILLFPPPIPLLVAFVTVLVAQAAQTRKPLHKRAFNVCHTTLVVGLCNLVFVRVAGPIDVLHPGHIVAA